jgi:uncharacterized protein YceK
MMDKHITRLFIFAILFILIGCGTFGTVIIEDNKECKSLIYSGTRAMSQGNPHSMFFIDIPFSFVADTILLPYTIPATLLCKPESTKLEKNRK